MRSFQLLTITLMVCLLLSGAYGQGGLFQTLRNMFRPSRQTQPARPAFRPQPQQQFRQEPQPQFQSQQPQQQPQFQQQQPQFQQQQPQFQQQQPQFQQQRPQVQLQQPQFQQQRPQVQLQQPNVQQFRPQPQQPASRPVFSSRPVVTQQANQQQQTRAQFTQTSQNQQQQQQSTCPALPAEDFGDREDREGGPRCPDGLAPAFQYRGYDVILTWIETSHPAWNTGCRNFTGINADNYCRAQGGRAVSLDDNEAAEQYMKQAAIYAQRYFWTGGRLNHRCGVLTWPSGKSEGWIRGQRFWSTTGGSRNKGPQPDNRHETEDGHPGEPEKCLGVLNNFYADGIKWHDVACHHRKPTICEIPL